MRPFSLRFKTPGTVRFLAADEPLSAAGGVSASYPDTADGVDVDANVQPGKVSHDVRDGVDCYSQEFVVCLLTDPSALNGGLGVRRGDAFWWDRDGSTMVATQDAVPVGSLWRVRCLAVR